MWRMKSLYINGPEKCEQNDMRTLCMDFVKRMFFLHESTKVQCPCTWIYEENSHAVLGHGDKSFRGRELQMVQEKGEVTLTELC